jgi:hypothetical protein
MKVLVSLFVVTLFFSVSAFAGPNFGIKGGANFANVRVDVPVDVESISYTDRTGIIAGVFGELLVPVVSNLSLRGDLLYVQKGTKYNFLDSDVTVSEDEITFAPYLAYSLTSITRIQPFIEVGPELGVNVRDRTTVNGHAHGSGGAWNAMNLSINFGAGLLIPIHNHSLTIDGRYNSGLTDMGTWIPNYIDGTRTWTNGFQVLIGYSLLNLP